jgi:hypothetical protein
MGGPPSGSPAPPPMAPSVSWLMERFQVAWIWGAWVPILPPDHPFRQALPLVSAS